MGGGVNKNTETKLRTLQDYAHNWLLKLHESHTSTKTKIFLHKFNVYY